MTNIAFHVNVADKLGHSCRLLRKAYLAGAQLVVTGTRDVLAELDQLLWTFSAPDFIPHYRATTNPDSQAVHSRVLMGTPVLLVESPRDCVHHGVLVNLGSDIPGEFERFERLIEVVSPLEIDRSAGRFRWKQYTEMGYDLKKHDFAAAPAGKSV